MRAPQHRNNYPPVVTVRCKGIERQENKEGNRALSTGRIRLSSPSSISLGASIRRVYNTSVALMEVVDDICFVTASPLGCYQG